MHAPLKQFLQEFANLRNEPSSIERFLRRYKPMIPPVMPKAGRDDRSWTEDQKVKNWLLDEIQSWIREAWREPDWRLRFYTVFWLLTYVSGPRVILRPRNAIKPNFPSTPFEESLLIFLLRDFHLAKFCGNPDCPAPYFFARKVMQKYCSDACSRPAQIEAKNRYWKTKGKRKREERRKEKSSMKGRTHGKKRRSL